MPTFTFYQCSSLTSIEIPNSVTWIEKGAFSGCSSLTSIEIPNSVTEIGDWAFAGCPIKCFSVDKDNPNYTSEDGVLFDKNKKKLIRFCTGRETDCYRVPDGVVCLDSYAFANAMHLRELFLPDTIREIGWGMFDEWGKITKLHLRVEDPNVITVDERFALDHCTLYVPVGTGYAYRHHAVFGKFKEVIIER